MLLTIGSSVKDENNKCFILEEIIGQGGFGCVFKARRENDGEVYAVKTVLPYFPDDSALEAFKNEIQSAMRVTGENVIKYEYTHNGDVYHDLPPYIIMEFANGGTLRKVLEQKRKTGKQYKHSELLNISKQLAFGMKTINEILVHRDIKPENILVCEKVLKITDFGLSKIAAEHTRTLTFKGSGSYPYMAPEAWDSSKNTMQMDIYSMGVVFYELATLQYPYDICDYSYDGYKEAHLYSAIKNPENLNPSLSAQVVSLITRMLEKPIQKRFSTWDEIIHFLEKQNEPDLETSNIISMMISDKNKEDLAQQHQANEEARKEKEKSDFCKMVYSQFNTAIASSIKKFIEKFNAQYSGVEKYECPRDGRTYVPETRFTWKLQCPSSITITFDMEAVLKENYKRELYIDRDFRDIGTRIANYVPRYENSDILSWGAVTNSDGYGFNIILLKNDGLYGDWFVLKNTNSGISNSQRNPEPFAFRLNELPKEINNIKALHIYNTEVEPLNDELLYTWIRELSKKH